MIKRRKTKSTLAGSLLRFFLESKVALLVIAANWAAFWYLYFTPEGQLIYPQLILHPGNILQGYWWCFVSSGFIHSDINHLLFNMLGVLIFGRIVERQLGILKTCFIYIGALILSMSFSMFVYVFLLQKGIGIVGASGAVMGLLAAAMLLEPFAITYEMILPIPMMIKGWMFLYADLQGFLGGEKDGVSHLAHLFGALSIAFLVYFLSRRDKRMLQTGLIINVGTFALFFFLHQWFNVQIIYN